MSCGGRTRQVARVLGEGETIACFSTTKCTRQRRKSNPIYNDLGRHVSWLRIRSLNAQSCFGSITILPGESAELCSMTTFDRKSGNSTCVRSDIEAQACFNKVTGPSLSDSTVVSDFTKRGRRVRSALLGGRWHQAPFVLTSTPADPEHGQRSKSFPKKACQYCN